MPRIEETKLWVRDLHAGQFDKAGAPYFQHILRVHEILLRLFPDVSEDTQHAALLHDTIEDCEVDADDLRLRGYSDDTIQMVEAVTKYPNDGLTYAARIESLSHSGNVGAIQVKIADLTDNNDPSRLAALFVEQSTSLSQRYTKALIVLQGALEG